MFNNMAIANYEIKIFFYIGRFKNSDIDYVIVYWYLNNRFAVTINSHKLRLMMQRPVNDSPSNTGSCESLMPRKVQSLVSTNPFPNTAKVIKLESQNVRVIRTLEPHINDAFFYTTHRFVTKKRRNLKRWLLKNK